MGILGNISSGFRRTAVRLIRSRDTCQIGVADVTTICLIFRSDDPLTTESVSFCHFIFRRLTPTGPGKRKIFRHDAEFSFQDPVAGIQFDT